MFDIRQFIPQDFCLNCKGCCRFSEKESIWQPLLLNEEVKVITKDNTGGQEAVSPSYRIKSLPLEDYYICSFLDAENNHCKIYRMRPFECRLYPFLINKAGNATYLSVDLRCPFITDKLEKKEFKEYINYLISFLSLPVVAFTIKQNPHTFADYSKEENLRNLATLIF